MKPGDLLKLSDDGRCLIDEGAEIGITDVPESYTRLEVQFSKNGERPKAVGRIGPRDVCILLGVTDSHALVLCRGKFGWIGKHLVEAA